MLPHQYQQQTMRCIQPPLQSQHFPSVHTFSRPPSTVHYAPPPTMPPDFPLFMHLPAEIRTMIWEYALPDARVYEIMDVPRAKQKMNAVDGLMFANVHHEPPPALAAVCHESRYLVLEHHYRPLTLGGTTKYVDLARDLLLLEPYLQLKRLHRTLHFMGRIPLIRTHMAALALGTSYGINTGICHPVLNWKASKTNMAKLLAALATFPKLRTLLFIVHQEFQFEFDYRYPAPDSLTQPPLSAPAHTAHSAPLPSPPPDDARPQVVHQAYRFKFDVESNINRHPRRPHLNDLLFYPLENTKEGDGDKDDWDALLNGSAAPGAALFFSSSSSAPSAPVFPGMGTRLDGDMDDAENGEWCDPWPTNDDWRRFRRRFQRAVVATVKSGLADDSSGGDGDGAMNGAFSVAERGGPALAGAEDKKYQLFLQQQRCETSSVYGHGHVHAHGSKTASHHSMSGGGSGGSHGSIKSAAGSQRRYALNHKLPAIKGVSLLWRYNRGI